MTDAILVGMLDLGELSPEAPRPITRAEFEMLARTDFFSDDERVELLRGVMVRVTPPLPHPKHESAVQRLIRLLVLGIGERAWVRVNSTFAAGADSETLPDLAVVPLGNYESAFPAAAHLLIEVAVSSLRKDRKIKALIYAEAEVTEYWIVDVNGRAIEVHRKPLNGHYSEVQRYQPGDRINLATFPDVAIAVGDVIA